MFDVDQLNRDDDKDGGNVRNRRYLDFLDILLTAKDDAGKGLTDQEIQDEVDTFLFEGSTTDLLNGFLFDLENNGLSDSMADFCLATCYCLKGS